VFLFFGNPHDVRRNRLRFSQEQKVLSVSDIPLFVIGFVTAFISALIVVKALLKYVSRHDFAGFAYYRIVFGLTVLGFYRQKGRRFS
jgi:undecaprenyl pyrophosphate phosphatase UppP